MADLPTGTVTFLFTDIEGSTRMLQALGAQWRGVVDDHHHLMRTAIREAGGIDIRTEGDAVFAVFRSAPAAVSAAIAAQRALAAHPWPPGGAIRVRMGLHTGEGTVGGDDYVGIDVHRAARISSAAHGGQVLVSSATAELVASPPDGLSFGDLGRHRLKDLARPERIFQVVAEDLPSEFPPIRSLETPTNLPVTRSPFVGREAEMVRVRELLRGPGLLTLIGPGGSGKTRLALHVARQLLDDYADGVFFVGLDAISDPRLVASAIADAVGARAEGVRSVPETLRGHVRDLEALLVLDNFEQVLAAATLVAALLDAGPRLRILVTSRAPLHLAGEQELHLPPLAIPSDVEATSIDDLARVDAVALFVQRAAAIDPDFVLTDANAAAIAELCRRLDGLPLAIELAASRTRLLSPEAILARMEHRLELLTGGPVDLPVRQRTLREAIAWSHDLLDETERALFRRLAVFPGGCTLDGVETVANEGTDGRPGALDILASLVDKSLVSRQPAGNGSVRFSMLATIREFAFEQLDAAGERPALQARHAAWCVALAEAAEPHLRKVDQQAWLTQLEAEHDNLRAALRFAIDSDEADVALRLVASLWRYWHFHGHLAEGRRWADEALALPAASGRTRERAQALTALGGVAYWQQDISAFSAAYEEALAIARDLGDRRMVAQGIYNLAYARAYQGDIGAAVSMLGESRALFEELGDREGIADTLWFLGVGARLQGDLATSLEMATESLASHRATGDLFGVTDALFAVGRVAYATGDHEAAAASFFEALEHEEQVGNRTGIGIVLDNLAAQAGGLGDHARAVRLGGASEAIKEAAGGHAPPPLLDLPDPRVAARAALGDAPTDAMWAEGRAMPLERALAYAREVR